VKTIRELRQEHGWTQYELALRVGVHPQAVYLWESGRRTPQVPQLRKLGRIFGMCSDEIDLSTSRAVRGAEPTAEGSPAPVPPSDAAEHS
jgi:DNA-binding XRE family transcriptional regulator